MKLLRLPEVKRIMGHRADASIYNSIREGCFVDGIALGKRAKGWPDYEVEKICKARIAGFSDAQLKELVIHLHSERKKMYDYLVNK